MSNINTDRAGGFRRNAESETTGVKPPASLFSQSIKLTRDFIVPCESPEVLSTKELQGLLFSRNIEDALTDHAAMFINTVGFEHAKHYTSPGRPMRLSHSLMMLDLDFQKILLKYIGMFEISFRARFSRELAERRGAFAHRNSKNFVDQRYYNSFLNHYSSEMLRKVSRSHRLLEKYQRYGDLPIWCAVETMSLGTLSKLYKNTKSKAIKNAVANAFGIDYDLMASWLRALSDVRNRCAHFEKLLGTSLGSRPKKITGVEADNSNPFYIVLLLAELLTDEASFYSKDHVLTPSNMLIEDIAELFLEHPGPLEVSEIPRDWDKVLDQLVRKHGAQLNLIDRSPDVCQRKAYATVCLTNGNAPMVE